MLSCEALEELARGKTDAWLGNATSLCAAFAQSFFEGTPEASDLRRSTALLESLVSMQRRCPRVFGGQASHWGIDAGHLFGAWTAERAMSTVANAASTDDAVARTVESVSGRLLLGGYQGAAIHAVVWHAVWKRSTALNPSQWPAELWRYSEYLCNFARQRTHVYSERTLVTACIHGLGHGVWIASAVHGSSELHGFSACSQIYSGRLPYTFVSDLQRISRATAVCEDAPTVALGYVCSTGLYMGLWQHATLIEPGRPVGGYFKLCDAARFPAACFIFFFKKFRPIRSICLQSLPNANQTLRERSRKGCIFAAAATVKDGTSAAERCGTFVRMSEWLEWNAAEKLRWRACIAGAYYGTRRGWGQLGGDGCAGLRSTLSGSITLALQAHAAAALKEEEAFCQRVVAGAGDGATAGKWGETTGIASLRSIHLRQFPLDVLEAGNTLER